jgi:hypothetical protein
VRFIINVLIFAAVIIGAVWLYLYLRESAIWIGILDSVGTSRSMQELLLKTDVPYAVISYSVLAVAGAVTCYSIDSSVPLRWCFTLGLICAVANLLAFSSPYVKWVLLNTLISLGMLAAPVIGGYQIKCRAWHIRKRPPN